MMRFSRRGVGVVAVLTVGLVVLSILAPAWAQRGFGGRSRRMAYHAATDAQDIATTPDSTRISTALLRAADGPVIATWSGGFAFTSAPPRELYWEIAIRFDARPCIATLADPFCGTVGAPIRALPGSPDPASYNYDLTAGSMGFQTLTISVGGTTTARAVWPAGALQPNRLYRFEVRVQHGDHQHCVDDTAKPPCNPPGGVGNRLFTVEAFSSPADD